jgi:hypothetical protein
MAVLVPVVYIANAERKARMPEPNPGMTRKGNDDGSPLHARRKRLP